MTSSLPIGVIDSGVGGLTVLKALMKLLPHEDFVYLADTKRIPYGDKSFDEIKAYSMGNLSWMSRYGIKILVVACNTTSAIALKCLREAACVQVIGTVEPVVARLYRYSKSIGVLATSNTAKSKAFEDAFMAKNNALKVYSVACPKLVPLIESGDISSLTVRNAVHEYVDELIKYDVSKIIYGCTHYPILSSIVESLLPASIEMIDPALDVAYSVRNVLDASGLLNSRLMCGTATFYSTGELQRFSDLLPLFLPDKSWSSIKCVGVHHTSIPGID
ncbi:glutamate racemase [Rickettsiales endosymbiont of Peranema trichophorum]|uniref:glutamate racemase n=1 Tax=Rickettsiales endosymbiont of Peranema trichophorum TaxID=2486577 RepID=UPI0010234FE8|nr:glutamate racemase [Rickettsiales endosymbiont of Peranema trichophorum]RZI45387.1 glutamate racemase [Rickettsiales endosymbiont of Peranema trichophorum]